VNCSDITSTSPTASAVVAAVTKAREKKAAQDSVNIRKIAEFDYSDETFIEDRLSVSLLKSMDPASATVEELREAFCRDAESDRFAFKRPLTNCSNVPVTACAVAYDR
jgi:hypothetical protein